MSVSVQCPGCSSALQISSDKLGQKVKCRTCAEVFVAKTGSSKSGGKGSSSRSRKSKKGSSSGTGGVIAGLAAVLLLGIGGYLYMGRGGANEAAAPNSAPQASTIPASGTTGVAGTSNSSATPSTAPSGVWNAKDPLKDSLDWTGTLKVEIPLPEGEFKVVRPLVAGPFIATSSTSGFTVFDLRNNMAVKHVDLPPDHIIVKEALSPDGQHYAVVGFERPKPMPDAPKPDPATAGPPMPPQGKILILSTQSEQVSGQVGPIPGIDSPQWLAFRSPTELVAIGLSKADPMKGIKALWVGAVLKTDGTLVRQFVVANSVSSGNIQLSAGGRFLLTVEAFVFPANPLIAIDLESGQSLGRANTHDEVYKSVSLTDMAMSPDGSQIAVLQRYDDAFRVLLMNAENGQKIRQMTVLGDFTTILSTRVGGDKGIAWLPSGKHLVLFDGLVIDAQSAAVVSDLGNVRENTTESRPLGSTLLQIGSVTDRVLRSTPIELPAAR